MYFDAAKALIPDDDDEELIDIAKSRKKERLANEKSVEKSFIKGGDYKGRDLDRVQNAVNKLAKEGLSLETGDLKSLAKTSRYVWAWTLSITRLYSTCICLVRLLQIGKKILGRLQNSKAFKEQKTHT